MIKLEKEMVLLIHQLLAEQTGGAVGVRDMNLLDSALENIYVTFDGKDLYPTKEEKGARLGFNLISNHAFLDGNKRIGVHIMILFLALNGIELFHTENELLRVGLDVASGKMGYESLLAWVRLHRKNTI